MIYEDVFKQFGVKAAQKAFVKPSLYQRVYSSTIGMFTASVLLQCVKKGRSQTEDPLMSIFPSPENSILEGFQNFLYLCSYSIYRMVHLNCYSI